MYAYTSVLVNVLMAVLWLTSHTAYAMDRPIDQQVSPHSPQTINAECVDTLVGPASVQAMPTPMHSDNPADLPPAWLAFPFMILLLMIASGPLLYAHFWHKNYPKIAVLLASLVVGYYVFVLHDAVQPIEALVEYIQFIALIAALYVAAGGILIQVNQPGTPTTNLSLLLIGAILANLIGTTGASMLLIRPYIRLNQGRLRVYHIVFFIFIVSNVGGVLSPIGDPPLFLGFLKGVPFFWTLQHNLLPWLTALSLLSIIFFVLDVQNSAITTQGTTNPAAPPLSIVGKRNFFWLLIIIMAVFLDPQVFPGMPAIHYQGHAFSFLREIILFTVIGLSYYLASSPALLGNEFTLAPLQEVIWLFVGIFGTMTPAITLIGSFAQSETGSTMITPSTLYWGTGIFSSILDNAPTYLNFGAASMAAQGANIAKSADVQAYALGGVFVNSILRLKAIAVASVFFGAMTYIGNGPNFMVKAIAEHMGMRMPSFLSYTIRYAIPLLLPVLILIWAVFFAGLV